jgi:hypothetical protein
MKHDIVITENHESGRMVMQMEIDGNQLATKFMDSKADGLIYKILKYFDIDADITYIYKGGR